MNVNLMLSRNDQADSGMVGSQHEDGWGVQDISAPSDPGAVMVIHPWNIRLLHDVDVHLISS